MKSNKCEVKKREKDIVQLYKFYCPVMMYEGLNWCEKLKFYLQNVYLKNFLEHKSARLSTQKYH